ncbi:MAG TPA: hypothetical protein VGJ13_15410 [Pseudonocardiaceae bacterium]|jgi:hypothetical protein
MSATKPGGLSSGMTRAATVVAALALALVACSGGSGRSDPAVDSPVPLPPRHGASQQVGQENLAHLWPLTVPRGTMECRRGVQAVFVAPDGTAYALNDQASKAGYPSIEPLRATGADGDRISLGSLRGKTLKLCRE